MNNKLKAIIFVLFVFCTVLLTTSCASSDAPFEELDAQGNTVSVSFDANGGTFATGTTVVIDTFNPDKAPIDSEGNRYISILDPSDSKRGENNYFTPTVQGCFLAGWYTERTPVLDANGNHLDVFGGIAKETGKQPAYTYSGKWDFESSKYVIEENKSYSSSDPVITLYAGWAPKFAYEFYAFDGTLLGKYEFTPSATGKNELTLPDWNEETGEMNMGKFPSLKGKTFTALYLDSEKTQVVETAAIAHSGTFDYATANASGNIMKLYVDYKDGTWYKISTAKQFTNIKDREGCYEITADLDFTGINWPTLFTSGTFSGQIIGNGHTFTNIKNSSGTGVVINNTSSSYGGLFGQISSTAKITNITFDNVTLKLEGGTKNSLARFGLFAGLISDGAVFENVSVTNSTLQISNKVSLPKDCAIGLFAGMGTPEGIDISGITAEALNESDYRDTLSLEVNGNEITLTFTKK